MYGGGEFIEKIGFTLIQGYAMYRNYNSVQRFDSGHRLLTTAPVMK